MGAVIIVLAGVVIYQQRKIDHRDNDIKLLNGQLLAESKANAEKYIDMSQKYQEVQYSTSQTSQLLASKIEAVRGRGE